MSLLDGVGRVLLVHAHPDDETLSTGALVVELVSRGVEVSLVTATRGERGDVVPGPLSTLVGTPALTALRERELDHACEVLGITRRWWLGEPPARAADGAPRRYLDSGMTWLEPGLAGPAPDVDAQAFAVAPATEAVADLVALVTSSAPDLVVTYGPGGGYGHPDHVRAHEVTAAACRQLQVPFAEVVEQPQPGVEWFELAEYRAVVTAALRAYPSQLTVDGPDVVHCGGQREAIRTAVGLRRR